FHNVSDPWSNLCQHSWQFHPRAQTLILSFRTPYLPRQHPHRSTLFPDTTLFRSAFDRTPPRAGRTTASSRLVDPDSSERESRRRSEEHTSELQSLRHLVCRLLLEKKKKITFVNVKDDLCILPLSSDKVY